MPCRVLPLSYVLAPAASCFLVQKVELNEFSQCVGISLILDFKRKPLLLAQVPIEALLSPASGDEQLRLKRCTLGVRRTERMGKQKAKHL